jgi:hypothetical protein
MGKTSMRKTNRMCAMCKHWNGTIGSTTIKPVLGGTFQVEMTEKQTCYQRALPTTACFTCNKFEPRC